MSEYGAEVSPLELRIFSGDPNLVDLDTGDIVYVAAIENREGTFELKNSWQRIGLSQPRIRGIAQKHAPVYATHFIGLYDESQRKLLAIQYYKTR